MKGLIIWTQSVCRSTMGLYRALGNALDIPIVVPVWHHETAPGATDIRAAVGFCADEFSDMETIPVGEDYERGLSVLNSHPGWHHLFCVYQGSPCFRRLQLEAVRRGEHTAIGSEAPCNMFAGWKRLAKEAYLRTKLKRIVRGVVAASDFFVNYSGDDDRNARVIGWPQEKIIPFGYYPPPVPGTKCVKRAANRPFEILATGLMTWHRGCDVLVRALKILKDRGVAYHATITQKGPMLEELKSVAQRFGLPIDFTDFLPLDQLNRLYETCSVYVGAGRHEPWGMRLNDALNCGAPLVVSRGMGGVRLVDEYECGLAFANEDALDLACQLEKLATDDVLYAKCAENAFRAAGACSPEAKAEELAKIIRERWM